jgi:hypothetical protein
MRILSLWSIPSRALVIATWALAAPACGPANARIPVSGEVAGKLIHATVDAEPARYFVEAYLRGVRTPSVLDQRIEALDRTYAERLPSREELSELSRELSLDFATLFLAHKIDQQLGSSRLKAAAGRVMAAPSDAAARALIPTSAAVMFVPAWMYKDNPEIGADLECPRRAIADAGIATMRVPVKQDGTVEVNAAIIAQSIRDTRDAGRPFIIVSLSKSGIEVAEALTALAPDERRHIKAWINLEGTLRGTPLAAAALSFPGVVPVVPYFWVKGWDLAALRTLLPEVRRARWPRVAVPEDIYVVNFVATPLAAELTALGESGYSRMADDGPNDGLSLIIDTLVPGRQTIVALGVDHYMAYPDRPRRVLAVLAGVAEEVEAGRVCCHRRMPEASGVLSAAFVPRRQVSLPSPSQVLSMLRAADSDALALPYVE